MQRGRKCSCEKNPSKIIVIYLRPFFGFLVKNKKIYQQVNYFTATFCVFKSVVLMEDGRVCHIYWPNMTNVTAPICASIKHVKDLVQAPKRRAQVN